MKLSHIEVTVPIGRTERGQTLTVMDLLKAFATATGTEIGSLDFDRALDNPSQLHAKETIENAGRFRTLRALAQNSLQSGPVTFSQGGESVLRSVAAEGRQISPERRQVSIQVQLETGLNDGLGLDAALDAINAGL